MAGADAAEMREQILMLLDQFYADEPEEAVRPEKLYESLVTAKWVSATLKWDSKGFFSTQGVLKGGLVRG